MLIHEVDSQFTRVFCLRNQIDFHITLSLISTPSNLQQGDTSILSSRIGSLANESCNRWLIQSFERRRVCFFNSSSWRGYHISLFSDKTVQRPDIYLAGGFKPVYSYPYYGEDFTFDNKHQTNSCYPSWYPEAIVGLGLVLSPAWSEGSSRMVKLQCIVLLKDWIANIATIYDYCTWL